MVVNGWVSSLAYMLHVNCVLYFRKIDIKILRTQSASTIGGNSKDITCTARLIEKETTFILVLHGLNSTNLIVIHEHFKELKKMNNLPPVPSNLIN